MVDGYPAIERYSDERKEGSLTVMVADHYLVEIEVNGLGSDALQDWWRKVDAKKLAALSPADRSLPRVAQNPPGMTLQVLDR